ncbi:hypothetical protein M3689_07710 [Alkalihalophilus marmarensis]|uniref:Uncharacterized protein n=1 Tax=Alkalihalophilus marmarensis DSM 21297 TaxID=1188261 RepID=U6SNI7_9BACI|nr:hypothetical protein [Alkalihalophilus marmarensis]ERN52927.1 hypothetical protein A33I_14690 [Alkalihalophilus marmarensis DSM 21297]MCM3489180.1 hypothetical protein [Alkalihalophilus marmarensis]
MARLSRVTSLRANRIHTSFVNKMSSSNGVNPVMPVEKTEATKNPTKHSSDHQLTSYDYYYEKHLTQSSETNVHSDRFSRNEVQNNSTALLTSEKNDQEKELVIKLVNSYNQLIQSLKHTDQISCQNDTAKLHQVYAGFAAIFEGYGVIETAHSLLTFDEKIYSIKNENRTKVTSEFIGSFMKKVLSEYQSILADKCEPTLNNNPYEKLPYHHTGILFEERL